MTREEMHASLEDALESIESISRTFNDPNEHSLGELVDDTPVYELVSELDLSARHLRGVVRILTR